jgi:CrcB protein
VASAGEDAGVPVGAHGREPAARLERLRRHYDWRELAAIYAGGCLGAVARVGIDQLIPGRAGHWPWATFVINVAGCLALGYFTTRLQERLPLTLYRRPFAGTGFCGAFTTFSTFQLEILTLLDHGRGGLAAAYAAASVAAGFAGVALATAVVRRVRTVT